MQLAKKGPESRDSLTVCGPYAIFISVKRFLTVTISLALVSCASKKATDPVGPGGGTNTATVTFSGGSILAEIAASASARGTGLMARSAASIGANGGMLFVYPTDQDPNTVGFYMVSTPTPLSIIFIDANMKVMNGADMAPNTSTIHQAAGPFRYALEANLGWFDAHGVKVGNTVSFTLPTGTIVSPCCP